MLECTVGTTRDTGSWYRNILRRALWLKGKGEARHKCSICDDRDSVENWDHLWQYPKLKPTWDKLIQLANTTTGDYHTGHSTTLPRLPLPRGRWSRGINPRYTAQVEIGADSIFSISMNCLLFLDRRLLSATLVLYKFKIETLFIAICVYIAGPQPTSLTTPTNRVCNRGRVRPGKHD